MITKKSESSILIPNQKYLNPESESRRKSKQPCQFWFIAAFILDSGSLPAGRQAWLLNSRFTILGKV